MKLDNEAFSQIKKEYIASIPEKIVQLTLMFDQAQNSKNKTEYRNELYRLVHNLVASGHMYGFEEVSKIAIDISNIIQIVPDNRNFNEDEHRELSNKLIILLKLLEHIVQNQGN